MRRAVFVVTIVVLLSLEADSSLARQATPSADPCAGLEAYAAASHRVDARFQARLQDEQLSLQEAPSFSAADWATLAALYDEMGTGLAAIEPPPILAEWHRLGLDYVRLRSAWAREIAESGLATANARVGVPLAEAMQATYEAGQQVLATCPQFLEVILPQRVRAPPPRWPPRCRDGSHAKRGGARLPSTGTINQTRH